MTMLSKVREVARVLGEMRKVIPALGYKMPGLESKDSLGLLFEQTVARCPDNTMLLFEGRQWTYREFNEEVNQLAHLLTERGVKRGDTVALFMENRAEYVLSLLALVKVGATASLINNSLSGAALVHCIKATEAKGCIVGEERCEVLAEVLEEVDFQGAADWR